MISIITDTIIHFMFRVRVAVYINSCILVSFLLPFAWHSCPLILPHLLVCIFSRFCIWLLYLSYLPSLLCVCVPLDPVTLLHLHVDILACVWVCVCVCVYHFSVVSVPSVLHIELYSVHCSLISERVLLALEVPRLRPLVLLIRLRWIWSIGVISTGENLWTGTKSGPNATLSITNATGLARDRTQAFTVRGLRLAVWSMAQSV